MLFNKTLRLKFKTFNSKNFLNCTKDCTIIKFLIRSNEFERFIIWFEKLSNKSNKTFKNDIYYLLDISTDNSALFILLLRKSSIVDITINITILFFFLSLYYENRNLDSDVYMLIFLFVMINRSLRDLLDLYVSN